MNDQIGFVSYLIIALILSLNLVVLTGFAGGEGTMNNNQNMPKIDKREYENIEKATFALGCFWGGDARFGALDGVIRTRVGYVG